MAKDYALEAELLSKFDANSEATAMATQEAMLFAGRRTGTYRQAAMQMDAALDRICDNNAEKLCAISYLLGCLTANEREPMRDMLRSVVPALAHILTTET